jgi:hypothetical protein
VKATLRFTRAAQRKYAKARTVALRVTATQGRASVTRATTLRR